MIRLLVLVLCVVPCIAGAAAPSPTTTIPPQIRAQICIMEDTYKGVDTMMDNMSGRIMDKMCAGSIGPNYTPLLITFSGIESILGAIRIYINVTLPTKNFMKETMPKSFMDYIGSILGDILGLGLNGMCKVMTEADKLVKCLGIEDFDKFVGSGTLKSMQALPLPWKGCSPCDYDALSDEIAAMPTTNVDTHRENITGPDAPCTVVDAPWEEVPLAGAGEPSAGKACRGVGCHYDKTSQTCVR